MKNALKGRPATLSPTLEPLMLIPALCVYIDITVDSLVFSCHLAGRIAEEVTPSIMLRLKHFPFSSELNAFKRQQRNRLLWCGVPIENTEMPQSSRLPINIMTYRYLFDRIIIFQVIRMLLLFLDCPRAMMANIEIKHIT